MKSKKYMIDKYRNNMFNLMMIGTVVMAITLTVLTLDNIEAFTGEGHLAFWSIIISGIAYYTYSNIIIKIFTKGE